MYLNLFSFGCKSIQLSSKTAMVVVLSHFQFQKRTRTLIYATYIIHLRLNNSFIDMLQYTLTGKQSWEVR